MSLIVDGTTGVTFNDSSLQGAAASPFGLKNRIINGDMVIDQRNAGASVTPANGAVTYTLDRWAFYVNQASKLTAQQSTTAPSGFINSLKVTSSSAYSVGSGDRFILQQYIEGLNVADLGWGTANAKAVTLSFQVYSSLTGTFGGSIKNNDGTRSYPFSYTISSANTWEQKTLTIAGDTSGTWLTTNGAGVIVNFGLGTGSTFSGTAGAWASANYDSATGATSVVGTNGATFYITGVQLERNTTATPFEWLPYTTKLQLCQRYFFRSTNSYLGVGQGGIAMFYGFNTTEASGYNKFPVSMRAAPSITFYDNAGTANSVHRLGTADTGATVTAGWINIECWSWINKTSGWSVGNLMAACWNASAEL